MSEAPHNVFSPATRELRTWVSVAKRLAADAQVPMVWRVKFADVALELSDGLFDAREIPPASDEMIDAIMFHRR